MSSFCGDDVAGLMAGTKVEVVGIAPDDNGLRVYLTHRAMRLYAVIDDAAAAEQVRGMWNSGQRFAIPKPPPQCVFKEGEAA